MNNPYPTSCGCDTPETHRPPHKDKQSVGMAYVPMQKWKDVMDGCAGLKHGTIFEELIRPFEGVKAACSTFGQSNSNCNCNHNNYYRRGMK